MKCPKCGYVGFEDVERCRHCGYEFSLLTSTDELDLRIKDTTSGDSLEDVVLPDIPLTPPTPRSALSLFDTEPLITKPSPPRPPLAVRRSTPEVPRLRSQPRPASFEFSPDARPPAEPTPPLAGSVTSGAGHPPAANGFDDEEAAGLGARLSAVVIDLLLLSAVDAAVIYFTLQICGLTVDDLALIPKIPLVAFIAVQNVGYLVAFTAGGQTIGKMAMGIRVVPADELATLDVGHAAVRTLVWLALALPAGLGFLTALLGHDHRGLHDRFAGTRVVRA
jgi:uncharacterized RDD family membrane protein YckC